MRGISPVDTEKHPRVARYQDRYVEDYGFEAVMVAARQRLVMDVLRKTNPKVVLEVGCGMDMLAERANQAGIPVEQWIIVEPGAVCHDIYRLNLA